MEMEGFKCKNCGHTEGRFGATDTETVLCCDRCGRVQLKVRRGTQEALKWFEDIHGPKGNVITSINTMLETKSPTKLCDFYVFTVRELSDLLLKRCNEIEETQDNKREARIEDIIDSAMDWIAGKIVDTLLDEARQNYKKWVDKVGANAPEVTYRKGIIKGIRSCLTLVEQEIKGGQNNDKRNS